MPIISPPDFVRSGHLDTLYHRFTGLSYRGYSIACTVDDSATLMYGLRFMLNADINSSQDSLRRHHGFSIRCLAL